MEDVVVLELAAEAVRNPFRRLGEQAPFFPQM
jgi:hypothetical protein